MERRVHLKVDGRSHDVSADPAMPLLYALRDDLGMNNPRFGCGLAQCGACTVLVDGTPTRSCVMPLAAVEHKEIKTLAGLGTPEHPHPIQTAFIEEQAVQCGYCLNGWIMTSAALLAEHPKPTDEQITTALEPLVCRCGTQAQVVRAIHRASGRMQA